MNEWLIQIDRVFDDLHSTEASGIISNPGKTAPLPRAGDWFKLVPLTADEKQTILSKPLMT